MSSLAQVIPEQQPAFEARALPPQRAPSPRWSLATRIAFRLCVVYFGLYVLTTQMLGAMLPVPGVNLPRFGTIPPMRNVVQWIGTHVLGITAPMPFAMTGSGDKLYDWVQAFSLLLVAVVATVIWSVAARQRESHIQVEKWFRLFTRLAVGTTFLTYGFAKLVPLQMPTLALQRLVQPFGTFSPMGVLWYSIGASPAYEIVLGAAEVLGGVLLLYPRTAVVGALVCLVDATQIFISNMTYDVPVKLFAFHLILFSLFLLARNGSRMFDLFIRFRSREILPEPPLGRTSRARRGAVIAQLVFGAFVIVRFTQGSIEGWKQYGGGAPRSPLFGIWDVEQMVVDGVERPALVSDTTRFRRVLFQRPTGVSFQRMNDTFRGFIASVDTTAKTLTITMADSTKPKSVLAYQRPTKDQLILDGTFDGRPTRFRLAFRDPDSFLQRSRGFHWISEVPFNR